MRHAGLMSLILAGLVVAACAPAATPTPTPPEATPTSPAPTPQANATPSAANADVEFVRATQAASGTWTFAVTVRHPDTGWEDYADGWDVLTPEGA